MKTIAIAGAGAMGGRVGVALHQAGYEVTLIDRWQAHLDAINTNGVEIQTEDETYTVDIPATSPQEVSDTFDLIIILTKSMDATTMLSELQQVGAITNDTVLLAMMNGLGHEETLSQFVPKSQIYLAVTMWTAGLRGPGQLLLEGTGTIDFQRADGVKDERATDILNAFNKANLNATISDNVFETIWSKATLNSVLNPLCTILDKTIYEFGAYTQARAMIAPLIQEIVTVAEARDVYLNTDQLIQKVEAAYPKEAQGLHYPSMHQDYSKGRLTEIDYLNGQISKYGKDLNVPTPINDMLTHQIHQLEMKNKAIK